MSRSRRSILTCASSLVYTLVTALVSFIAVPFLVRYLGNECLGASRVLTDWYGQFKLLELGLGATLLPMLANALGHRDAAKLRQVMGAGVRAYLGVTIAFLAAGAILAALVSRLITVGDGHLGDLRTASLLGLASFLFTPLQPLRLLADARQEGFSVSASLLIQSLATTGFSLLLAWAGWGITGQIAAFVVGTLVFHTLMLARVSPSLPPLHISVLSTKIDKDIWRDLWSTSRPTFFREMCARVSLLSDTIMVAFLLQPALVVPMVLTQRLSNLAQGQLQGIMSASWAGLAELNALGLRDVFRRRLLELTTLLTVISIALLVPIAAFNGTFVARWVGTDYFGGSSFTLVAAANAYLLSLFTLWDCCFVGTRQVSRLVPAAAISTVVNFGTSVVLTYRLGIIGPLVGTLVGSLGVNAWYLPYLLKKHFDVPLSAIAKSIAKPMAIGFPYAVIVWWFAHAQPPTSWLRLGVDMGVSAALYLALAWLTVLNSVDRAEWIVRLRFLFRPGPAV